MKRLLAALAVIALLGGAGSASAWSTAGRAGTTGGAPTDAHYLTDQAESGLSGEVVVSAYGKALATAESYSVMRSLLGLAISADVQAYAAALGVYAGISPSADVQAVLGAGTNAAIKTLLGYYISGDAMTGSLTGNVTGNCSGTAGGLSGKPNVIVGTVTYDSLAAGAAVPDGSHFFDASNTGAPDYSSPTPAEGQCAYNKTTHRLVCHNGTNWTTQVVAYTSDVTGGTTEVVKTGSANLSAAEVTGTMLNNYGQTSSTNATLTAPTAASAMNFMLIVGALLDTTKYVEFKAAASDKIYWDGVAGADNGSIRATAQPIGSYISCWTFKSGASSWDWICRSGIGTWTAQ